MLITQNTLLEYTLTYYNQGLSIIPIPAKSKEAQICWKRYQDERPAQEQIQEWFSGNENQNIAVVLGEVSKRLCCRDFDDIQSYQYWVGKYPNLAAMLPTVKTSRGRHVYFQSNHQGITKLTNGELRGKGGYCLLPPSMHPDGTQYEWIIQLGKTIPWIEPEEGGLTEDTEEAEDTEEIEAMVQFHSTEPLGIRIEKTIQATCPRQEGERNSNIFQFARYLKSFPELKDCDVKDLKPYVVQWHQKALPFIATKSFDETWSDFTYSLGRVKYPVGDSILQKAIAAALQAEDILPEAEGYEPDTQKLIRLCYELQALQGDQPFWLSCRDAGKFIGLSHESANKRLQMLVTEGILKAVVTHTKTKSTRHRYIAR